MYLSMDVRGAWDGFCRSIEQHQNTFLHTLLVLCALGIAVAVETDGMRLRAFFAVAALGSGAASVYFVLRGSARAYWGVALLFFCLGAWRGAMVVTPPATDLSHFARTEGVLTARLTDAPQIEEDGNGGIRVRYAAEAISFAPAGKTAHPVTGGLYLYANESLSEQRPQAQAGDLVRAHGKVRLPQNYNNPGQIDTVRLLQSQGITARFAAQRDGVHIEYVPGESLARIAGRIRTHYLAAMQRAMPDADAAALFAMLFGGYAGLKPALVEAFTATGIVHILSVSGSHISLLAATVGWLGRLCRVPQGALTVIVLIVIAFYTMLAGFVPPAVRAALMGGLTYIALVLEREKDARRLLTMTGLGILLWSPLLLYNISFQLSFGATAGLLYLAPHLQEKWKRLPYALRSGLSVTVAAQLSVLPLLAWYFHQVSASALLANLVVTPILELLMMLGLLAGVLAWAMPLLGQLVFAFDSLLLGASYEMTRILATLPGSTVYLPTMHAGGVLVYYTALVAWLTPREDARRARMKAWCMAHSTALGIVCTLVFGGAALSALATMREPPMMRVHFIDVHQGNAALIVTPHGRAFMIDTGGVRGGAYDIGGRVDVPYLLHYGVRFLEAIFLTHADADHAAGAGSILAKMPVASLWIGNDPFDAYAASFGAFVQPSQIQKQTKLRVAETGATMSLDGVRVEVLHAPPASRGGNEASVVYRVSYGVVSFLFVGDLVIAQEEALLQTRHDLRATVLQVGHHGALTSSSPAFVTAVSPQYAVFGVGADNSFGHPRPEIVERFQRQGAAIFRTDEDGAVVFSTDGKSIQSFAFCRSDRF